MKCLYPLSSKFLCTVTMSKERHLAEGFASSYIKSCLMLQANDSWEGWVSLQRWSLVWAVKRAAWSRPLSQAGGESRRPETARGGPSGGQA